MFENEEEFPTKGKQRDHRNKRKIKEKIRDRFGKQRKNKAAEEDSFEKLKDFYNEE